jgi:ribA/ribD-fused uncharacterized protein
LAFGRSDASIASLAAHGLYWWDIRSDWSKIKFERMKQVLTAKFAQYDDLTMLLLSTGQARLVESATVDNAVNRLWGEVNGRGKNMLGKLLMEVRADLQSNQTDAKDPGPTNARRSASRGERAAVAR